MVLEQVIVPRVRMPQSSGLLKTDDGSKLFLKLVIGAIAIGVLVFLLSKLGVFQTQIYVERQVKVQ
jgi:hypothetical protein